MGGRPAFEESGLSRFNSEAQKILYVSPLSVVNRELDFWAIASMFGHRSNDWHQMT